jgi:hypothetical protein
MRIIVKLGILLLACSGAMCCPDSPDCRRCQDIDGDNFCTVCIDSIYDSGKRECQPIPKSQLISQCVTYMSGENKILCDVCDFGFYTSSDNLRCVSFDDPLCATGFHNTCESCFYQHVLNRETNNCKKIQICNLENCSICKDAVDRDPPTCIACNQGFAINPNRNKGESGCVKSINNCSIVNEYEPNVCEICMPGYYITSKASCEKVPGSGDEIQARASFARSLWVSKPPEREMQV